MVAVRNEKLNRLQRTLPVGLVVDTAWLAKNGYSKSLRDKYLASGWLERVTRGVYQRPAAGLPSAVLAKDRIEWERVVLSLQNLLQLGVSVGGRTALDLQGFAHYLPAGGGQSVHIYASEPLPSWIDKIPSNATFVVHNDDRLFARAGSGLDSVRRTVRTGEAQPEAVADSDSVIEWSYWHWPLTLSTPERAILELLDELPTHESFEHVDALFGGLGTLMPRRLQRLLTACQSVKVKRLFLFFADRHNHAWLKRLDRNRIDLGSGKRSLVPGGRLDPKYLITVPDSLLKQSDGL